MSRKEWVFGNSGEICAYCHKPITEICGCGSNDLKFKALFKNLADAETELAAQKELIRRAAEMVRAIKVYDEQRKDGCAIYADWQPVESLIYNDSTLLPELEKAGRE